MRQKQTQETEQPTVVSSLPKVSEQKSETETSSELVQDTEAISTRPLREATPKSQTRNYDPNQLIQEIDERIRLASAEERETLIPQRAELLRQNEAQREAEHRRNTETRNFVFRLMGALSGIGPGTYMAMNTTHVVPWLIGFFMIGGGLAGVAPEFVKENYDKTLNTVGKLFGRSPDETKPNGSEK